MTLLNIGVPYTIFDATELTSASVIVALPSRTTTVNFVFTVSETPDAIAIELGLSSDGVNFNTEASFDQSAFSDTLIIETPVINTSYKFARVKITANDVELTVIALAKVA